MVRQVDKDRGNLVLIGIRGNAIEDRPEGKIQSLVAHGILIVIIIIIGIIITPGISSAAGISDILYSKIVFWALWLLPIVLLAFSANLIGLEVDGIYERGVSNRRATLFECRRGEGFAPYESITSVKLENRDTPKGVLEVLTMYSGKPEVPALRPFVNYGYKNDFWNRLIQTLRDHCPNASWIDERQPSKL